MKKRNLNSLALKKTTISNFLIGGMVNDSDNACPSAVTCNSVCFCVDEEEAGSYIPIPESKYCHSPADNAHAHANAAG